MREIRFRGKKVDTGEWVYGYYAKTTVNPLEVPLCIAHCRIHHLIIIDGTMFYVDEKTVGEYIGLHDSKGAEVFEGDRIRCEAIDADGHSHSMTGEIQWDSEECGFVVFSDSDKWPVIAMRFVTLIEVRGNIHQPPSGEEG